MVRFNHQPVWFFSPLFSVYWENWESGIQQFAHPHNYGVASLIPAQVKKNTNLLKISFDLYFNVCGPISEIDSSAAVRVFIQNSW